MRNRPNSYDKAGASSDFSNNEGFHNYQDRTGKKDTRHERQSHSPNQQRSEWNRPSLLNSDRFESQSRQGYTPANSSDASMYGTGYGSGSYQSDQFDAQYNSNYGYGANSTPRHEYESSRFDQRNSHHPTNTSGQFSWQNSEGKSGLHAGKGPKGYRRSDERIREEISEALSADSEIDATEIEVEIKDGIVTLSGTVESRQIKRMAEDAAERISGVQDVKNDLRVMTSSESATRSTQQGKTNLAGRQSTTSQSISTKSVQ